MGAYGHSSDHKIFSIETQIFRMITRVTVCNTRDMIKCYELTVFLKLLAGSQLFVLCDIFSGLTGSLLNVGNHLERAGRFNEILMFPYETYCLYLEIFCLCTLFI